MTIIIIIIDFLEHCHVITTIFLLSSFSLFPSTAAQAASPLPVAPRAPNDNANASLVILLVALIFAFFMTGFCAVYIGHCAETYVVSGTAAIGPRGIDPEVLSTFPIMVYSNVKHLKTGHNVALQCAVCLTEYKDVDKLRLLPKCSHVFHPDCIDAWLASHVTCPVCRAKLKPENGEVKVEIGVENGEGQVFDESSERRGVVFWEGMEGGIGGGVDGVVGKGNGSSKVGAFGVLVRSHSTGHSLVEPGKSFERFTLRLPEELRKQILDVNNKCGGSMKRSASYDVVWQCGEGKRGWGRSEVGGGEGSRSKGKNNRWVLSMTTPPFVSRGWSSSWGVAPYECNACSGIPRFSASSVAREGKEWERRTSLQVV